MTLRRRWQRTFRIQDPRNRVLRVGSGGVSLHDVVLGEDLWSLEWTDVVEIVAFKVDAFVVDHLCLGFVVRGSDTMHIADEETAGWRELNDELARQFEVRFETWFGAVAFPAFAENRTVLWRAV